MIDNNHPPAEGGLPVMRPSKAESNIICNLFVFIFISPRSAPASRVFYLVQCYVRLDSYPLIDICCDYAK